MVWQSWNGAGCGSIKGWKLVGSLHDLRSWSRSVRNFLLMNPYLLLVIHRGAQFGIQQTDVVFVLNTHSAVKAFSHGNLTLGGMKRSVI